MKKTLTLFISGIFITIVTICVVGMFMPKVYDISYDHFEPFSPTHQKVEFETTFKVTEDVPTIGAASAFYPFAGNLVQAMYDSSFYEDGILQLLSTTQAYENLVNQTVDIIIATMPSEEQQKMIEELNTTFEFVPLYKEPLCIYTNKKNKVSNLTKTQLKRIYENELNWKEFGGKDEMIHTYQLEKNNGSQTCFETISKNNTITPVHHEIYDMASIIDQVGQNPVGIGYAFYSYFAKMHINQKVKPIMIDNKVVTENDYPLQFDVYLIYCKGNQNSNVKKIEAFLTSEEGKKLIELAK